MRPADIPAGLRLCRAANWNQVEADWTLFLTSSPEGCRVALDDADQVVGSVATLRYGRAFGWIAMVLVSPEHRRAGIGTRLLHEALHILSDMESVRLDATPAGKTVYSPLGFREENRLERLQRIPLADLRSMPFLPRRAVRRMSDDEFDDVLRWDRGVFGADRRILLEMLRLAAPEYAWIAGTARVDGYLFGRHGYSFEHIGPLVARDESIARSLVSACLSEYGDRPFIIDVPLKSAWHAWLRALGFVEQRPFTRMCRGGQPVYDELEQMFAIAGPEYG